eukprot:1196395-Prorocentrum_minimum.AAC.1
MTTYEVGVVGADGSCVADRLTAPRKRRASGDLVRCAAAGEEYVNEWIAAYPSRNTLLQCPDARRAWVAGAGAGAGAVAI